MENDRDSYPIRLLNKAKADDFQSGELIRKIAFDGYITDAEIQADQFTFLN